VISVEIVSVDLRELMPRRRWWPVIQPGLGPVMCMKNERTHSDWMSRTCCGWILFIFVLFFHIIHLLYIIRLLLLLIMWPKAIRRC